VLSSDEAPVPGVAINVLADDEVVAQVVSGPTGQFDFNTIDPVRTRRWQLQLVDYDDASPLVLDAEIGYRYLVEFQLSSQE
jgi:hypothetical protein